MTPQGVLFGLTRADVRRDRISRIDVKRAIADCGGPGASWGKAVD